MSGSWYDSPFTGLFTRFSPAPRRAWDPDVWVCGGEVAPWGGANNGPLRAGGVGWTRADAEAGCAGEAVERLHLMPRPGDQFVEARYDAWPLAEQAVDPERWVLFHPEQYAQPGFPFEPLRRDTVCGWVCFRRAGSGQPWWVPEELAFALPRSGRHRFCPWVSTGLAAGRVGQPVLLRGLQEVIERDGVVGAWWGAYPLEEWGADAVLGELGERVSRRVLRPHLRYRFYRVDTPYSANVVLVSLQGEDREGFCFSAGTACRQTRAAAWEKALLEAVQGWHYVRWLRAERPAGCEALGDFADHALYYSLHPQRLSQTVLERARPPGDGAGDGPAETAAVLAGRLGEGRPVLFRVLTPPMLAPDWCVVRVVVPGLQPLHGNAAFAHLGGPLWGGRPLADFAALPPHPFP